MGFYYGSSFYNSSKSANRRFFAHRAAYGTVNSTSEEKGTDGKKNNTSEYNHNYYVKHKDKWKSDHSEYTEGDSDFDDDKYDEKNRIGNTSFFAFKDKDGRWTVIEEDMKWKLPKGQELTDDIRKKLSEFDDSDIKNTDDFKKAVSGIVNGGEEEFDIDAAAWDVIRGRYKNGQERREALGDDYDAVQKRVNELWGKQKGSQQSSSSSGNSSSNASGKRTFEEVKKNYYDNTKINSVSMTTQAANKTITDLGKILLKELK